MLKRNNSFLKQETRKRLDSKKRRKLAKAWHLGGMSGRQKFSVKRAIEHVVRKDKTYNGKRAQLSKKELLMIPRSMRPSPVLDYVFPDRNAKGHWRKFEDRSVSNSGEPLEVDLENFSFIDNPGGAIAGLQQVARLEAVAHSVRINFKDRYCLDVVPYMLLTEFWSDMLPIFRGGEMQVPMQKVLAAIGIEEDLKVGFPDIRDFDDVWAFPLTRRRKPGDSRSKSIYFDVPTRDYASDRFCDALNEWLGHREIGLELNRSGQSRIKNLLNELLENAERHSDGERRDGAWTVAGFLARRVVGSEERLLAHIGIISLGDTFAESLTRASASQQDKIERYLSHMTSVEASQSRETLKTLAALQDGVTCVREADEKGRGGTGLMEMLELTNLLGYSENSEFLPQITIISGDSCVQLRAPYVNCEAVSGKYGERVQWCNSGNSAKTPPETSHVYDLKKGLPGTAISIRFTLDPQYLQEIVGALPDA